MPLAERWFVLIWVVLCRIKQDTGERGWVPAWFIGKFGPGSGSGSESQPSSAATPTGPVPTSSTGATADLAGLGGTGEDGV